jgi:hypothetical protein
MRAELEALRSTLATMSSRPAFLVAVPLDKPTGWVGTWPPAAYYLAEPAGADRPDDQPMGGDLAAWSALVRIKAVGVALEQVMTHLDAAREALCPNGRPGSLTVTGRGVSVVFVRHEADYVDRDVTPPKFLSVDTVRIESVPA